MKKRIAFGIILIISAFVLPWWISFVASLIGLFYFKNLYEVIFVGLIIDSLYGVGVVLYGFEFVFTAFFLISFFAISKFKKSLLL
jgi:hypothetical protein